MQNESKPLQGENMLLLTEVPEEAIRLYFRSRRELVKQYTDSHLDFSNILKIQRDNIKWDLIPNIINAFLVFPYIMTKRIAYWIDVLGWENPRKQFRRIPMGWRTRFQKEMDRRLYLYFFEVPLEF